MRWTYGIVPVVAGADKFLHLLTDWNQYLAPVVTDLLPVPAGTFMSIVGVIEIVAGILVLARPRAGSLVVALWLLGIAVNLVLTGRYFDIAVRDTVMAIGAYCLHLLWQDRKELGA
ncbi:MAG: tRNA (5-methylaminomethyl-2-thiouridylate)-methyltransferase [Chitinophagaceae bacterium]|nr:MAG: tRNA (5-methylaminomethyl-2-thiouridylate)-methyltransferase [Chitinophagaceae bacterium]